MANGINNIYHYRNFPTDNSVIRMNKDTLYSGFVLDLETEPITIILPKTDNRYMSLHLIDQDHYTVGFHKSTM